MEAWRDGSSCWRYPKLFSAHGALPIKVIVDGGRYRGEPTEEVQMEMHDYPRAMRNGTLPDAAYVFTDVQDELACEDLFHLVPRSHATRARLILSMGSWGNGRPFHAHGPALFGLMHGVKRWFVRRPNATFAWQTYEVARDDLRTSEELPDGWADQLWQCPQREGELRLANTLRHGWRAVAVRVADLGGLKVDADDALDETAEVEAFERARPPKPRVRGKRTLDARFRDADQARYRDAPRVLVAAEDRGDAWAKTERERLRVAPRYAADDDAAALHWQTYYRAHRARGRVAAARKDRARRAREQREKEEWALTQQERSRYVSVRCGLEVFEPDLLAGRAAPAAPAAAAKAPDDADDADAAKGPFEGDECPIVEDLHVPRRRGLEARRRASRPRGERARKSPCAPRRSSRASAPSASTGTRGRSRTRRARPRASSRSRSTTATWTTPCGARTSACRGSRAGTASRRSTARRTTTTPRRSSA